MQVVHVLQDGDRARTQTPSLSPTSLPPTRMSCLRQRKYQSQTVGRRAPQDCPVPSQGQEQRRGAGRV